jgi:predicted secreted protein
MAFKHGKNASFKVDNSGGTLTDISSYLNEVSLPRSIETAETTSFQTAGGAKTYVVGLNDSTVSISGTWDATLDAHLAGILGQDASVSFEYGPEGTGTGAVKYTGEGLMTSYETSSPVADVVTFSAEFQVTGTVTRGTFA